VTEEVIEGKEEYLGDGLYVSTEGGQIKLRAPRERGDHEVYLDHQTLGSLLAYVEKTFGVKVTITISADDVTTMKDKTDEQS
jgi:hypothetical protein